MDRYRLGLFLLCAYLTCFSAYASTPEKGVRFDLKQNRFSVGGTASIPYYVTRLGTMGFDINVEPSASYLVINNLEISLAAHVRGPLAVNDPSYRNTNPINWGFALGARYYFDLGKSLFPYVGLLAGFNMADDVAESLELDLGGSGGLLVALTDALALDVGLQARATVSSDTFLKAQIIPAVLGIRYYF
jgi:hypothetical protein